MSELHVLPQRATRSPGADLLEADLEAVLDRTVAQLEVIEREFETSRLAIAESAYPQAWKDWRLAHLELRRQRDRAPLVQLAAHVHQQLDSARLLNDWAGRSAGEGERSGGSLH